MNNKIIFLIACATFWVACSESGTDAKPFDASVVCPENARGTFVDERDGQEYKYTTIGDQVWMAQNLNYAMPETHIYNPLDGQMAEPWVKCLYEGDDCAEKGRVYGWVSAYNACPAGWHLPSREEWNRLIDNMGGREEVGFRIKSSSGWMVFNPGEDSLWTDDCGFSALPSLLGDEKVDGMYAAWWLVGFVYENGDFRSKVEYFNGRNFFSVEYMPLREGLVSVRCIRD